MLAVCLITSPSHLQHACSTHWWRLRQTCFIALVPCLCCRLSRQWTSSSNTTCWTHRISTSFGKYLKMKHFEVDVVQQQPSVSWQSSQQQLYCEQPAWPVKPSSCMCQNRLCNMKQAKPTSRICQHSKHTLNIAHQMPVLLEEDHVGHCTALSGQDVEFLVAWICKAGTISIVLSKAQRHAVTAVANVYLLLCSEACVWPASTW